MVSYWWPYIRTQCCAFFELPIKLSIHTLCSPHIPKNVYTKQSTHITIVWEFDCMPHTKGQYMGVCVVSGIAWWHKCRRGDFD